MSEALKSLLMLLTLLAGVATSPAVGARAQAPAADPARLTPAEVAALVAECGRRTSAMTDRLFNYAYRATNSEYELDKAGRVSRERTKVYEVYPVVTGRRTRWVQVQVAEDGVPFPAEKIERERGRAARQVAEALDAAEREKGKAAPPPSPYVPQFWSYGIRVEKSGGFGRRTIWFLTSTDFLRWHEFGRPRRATLDGREAILLDFRPRPGYVFDRTNVRFEEGVEEFGRAMSQLGGRLWIDAADRVVARIEAAPVRELSGARAAALGDAPDDSAPLGFEFARLPNGTWVPSRNWYNSHGREEVFWKTAASRASRYDDFKVFTASAGADRIETPRDPPR